MLTSKGDNVKKILISMLMISLMATSCLGPKDDDDDDDSSSGKSTTIPSMSINCTTSTDCGDDSANGATITVILTSEDCSSFAGPTSSNTYAFGGGIASCSGGTCTGNILEFVTYDAVSTSTISGDHSTMTVVAFIDTDGSDDGGPTTGEPLFCKENMDFTQAIELNGISWGDES